MVLLALATALFCLVRSSVAGGGFPPKVEGVTVVQSKFHENVSVSFKQPGICETTPGVKSYSGYVHLPPDFLDGQSYPVNTFFWFFEARNSPETAPLSIWLNGGAGASSMTGLLEELGPCTVGPDSATTILNPFSWNNNYNLIFIDQPNQVGFSYDIPTNGTQVPGDDGFGFDVIPGEPDLSQKGNLTTHIGTFSSQREQTTANSTLAAADALWNFLQVWLSTFPHYPSSNDRISLWTESYGGHYGPAFARYFHEQNTKLSPPRPGFRQLNLDTLGVISGMFDVSIQTETGITYAHSNSYNLPLINHTAHSSLLEAWSRPNDGCHSLLLACQHALSHYPANVTTPCHAADLEYGLLSEKLSESSIPRGLYDLTHPEADPFPPPHLHGYLRRESVLRALGVPVNYTFVSNAVGAGFIATYDWVLGGYVSDIGWLLDRGVAVHLVHGDRDPGCEWRGGERASLAVEWKGGREFKGTGYEELVTRKEGGEKKVKGFTRQAGNFSFTRMFQAGHEIPAYQPEASLAVFERAMGGRDVATGKVKVGEGYRTEGPNDVSGVKLVAEEMPRERCYILKPMTCSPEVWGRVVKGEVEVKDYYVVESDQVGNVGVDGANPMGDL